MQREYLYVFLGAAIRLLVAPFFMHQWDMTTMLTAPQQFLNGENVYANVYQETLSLQGRTGLPILFEGWLYLPHALYLYAPFYSLYAFLFPPGILPVINGYGQGPLAFLYPNIYVALLLIKLPVILADSAIIYLLARRNTRMGLIYALSPYSVFITSVWGNFDPLIGLLLMASVLMFERSKFASGILYSLSLVKIYTIFASGGYLVKLYKRPRELAEFIVGFVVAQLPTLYYFAIDRMSFLSVLFYHSARPIGGINIYGALLQIREVFFMGLVYRLLLALLVVIVTIVTIQVARKKLSLEESVVALMLTFIIFSPVTNEQYLAAVLPLMLLIGLQTNSLTYVSLLFIAVNSTYTYFAKPILWSSPSGQRIWEQAQEVWAQYYFNHQPQLMYLTGLAFGILAFITLRKLIGGRSMALHVSQTNTTI